jgi:hypothetical protein
MGILDAILSGFHEFASWLLELVQKIFDSLFTMLKDVFLWIFDQFLKLLAVLLGDIDLTGLESIPGISDIPEGVLNMISMLGIPQDLGLIVAALIIRFTLQLIPFTRLGS